MEDAQRFLRYVIPGLVLIIEISLYLFILFHQQFFEWISKLANSNSVFSVAFPISMFFVSGGIGFLLGVIYHRLYWSWPLRRLGVDHLPLINDAAERCWLKLQMLRDGTPIDPANLTRKAAWRIVTAFWFERSETSKRIKGATPRNNSLCDIMHGLGTMLVGSAIAIVLVALWLLIHFKLLNESPCTYSYIVFAIVAIIIIGIHICSFKEAAKDCQGVIDIFVADELRESFQKEGPIIINVPRIDLI